MVFARLHYIYLYKYICMNQRSTRRLDKTLATSIDESLHVVATLVYGA